MERWEGYSEEAVDYLLAAINGGIVWNELVHWMAFYEKPAVVATLINHVAAGKNRDQEVVKYLVHVHMVAAKGDKDLALEMAFWGPDSVHNAKYYLGQALGSGELIKGMARKCPDRWDAAKGYVGPKE